MNQLLKKPIERMVQGLAHWVAYKWETSAVKFVEAEAVGEAANMLINRIPFSVVIKREVDYRIICPSIKKNQRADLGLFFKNQCKCLLEFKLNENTNGGYEADIEKLMQVKALHPDIDCFVILIYRYSCSRAEPYFLCNGKASKSDIVNTTKKGLKYKIRVRKVGNAISSLSRDKMKKVVCIEIL